MPTFIRPERVTVTESGGGLAAAAVAGAAVVAVLLARIVAGLVWAIAAGAVVTVLAGVAVLVLLLRRSGGIWLVWAPPRAERPGLAAEPATVISEPRPLAIGAPPADWPDAYREVPEPERQDRI
jgi:hypothetical protein